MHNESKCEIVDVSNLINLYPKADPLPILINTAIDQDVSFAFEFMKHSYIRNDNEYSRRFGAYLCLAKANPKYYGNYIERLLDFVTEDDINEILRYIRSGLVPYKIWYEKLGEDLKSLWTVNQTSLPGMLTVYLMKTLRCSLIGFGKAVRYLKEECNLCDELLQVVQLVETRNLEIPDFLRTEYARAFSATTEEERRMFQDNELTLFSEILEGQINFPLSINKIEKAMEIDRDDFRRYVVDLWDTPLNAMGNGAQVKASVPTGANAFLDEMTGNNNQRNVPLPPDPNHNMGIFALDVLGYEWVEEDEELDVTEEFNELPKAEQHAIMEEPKKLHKIENKPTQYVLKKVAKDSSSRVMSETWFNTKEEALKFKREIEDSNPEITRVFDFIIEAGVKNV